VKLKHLEIFHAVMLTGTLSGAARLLHLTQPAATQALQSAERQLGYALFTRQRNRLVPTGEALALQPEVEKLMGQLEAVRRLAAAQRGDAVAALRVLVVPSLAVVQLPMALRSFRERHPGVPVRIRTLHSREIVQALALREADVGIVYAASPGAGLESRAIATGRLVVVSQGGVGRSAARGPVSLAEVLRQPGIRIDERDPLGALLAEQCARLGLSAEGEIVVQTHHTALVLAEQGFGPAVIDSFTAAARRDAGLVVQDIEPEVPVGLYALQPQGVRSGRVAEAFIEAFAKAVG
jgi:DNA-binding transcriptional LysR family regulator